MLGSYVDLGNPVASGPLSYGLTAWWLGLPTNSFGPTLVDLTGKYPLTIGSGPTWVGSPVGGFSGLNYTGSGAATTSANLSPGGGAFGVDCWVRYTTTSLVVAAGTDTGGGNWWLGTTGGEMRLSINGGSLATGVTQNDGLWHHLYANRVDTTNCEIWLDGARKATGSMAGSVTGGGFGVGRFGSSTGLDFIGDISGFRYWIGVAPDGGAVYRDAIVGGGYGTSLNRWSRRYYLLNTVGSPPVTVALTGQSATSAAGTLTPSAAVTLTGSAGTGGTGTLSPTLSPTLTGQYVTAYGLTSVPCPEGQARQYDVGPFTGGTGDFATLTGTVRVGRDPSYDENNDTVVRVAYSGTVADWTVVLQYGSNPLGAGRFLTVFCTSPAPADVTYTQDTGVTNCCETYSTFNEGGGGSGTQPTPPDVAPVGLCTGCGDLLPTTSVTQTGQDVTSAAGTITYSASTALTGLSSTIDTGTLTPETGYVISLTGQVVTTSAGTTTPAVAPTLTGDNATGAAGTMVVGVAYTLVGNGVTTAAGAVTVTIAATLTGDAGTPAVGTLTADLSTALTGNGVTTTTGTLTPALAAAIVGLSTTPAQGTIDPQTGWLIPLTGQSVTVSQGTLGVSITVGITGQSAAVSQGSLTASVHVPFGELYGKWAYPRPKTGRWQYTSPKAGKWAYPDELAGRWTPSV